MSGIFLNFNGTSIVQLMSFFILMYFLVKLLYKPFLGMLDKRREEIKSEYDKASEERAAAEKTERSVREKLEEIKKRVSIYEEESKKSILEYEIKEKNRINSEINSMIEKASVQIEDERMKAQKMFEAKVITLSIALTSKIIQQEIDEQSKKEFLMKQLSKLGEDK